MNTFGKLTWVFTPFSKRVNFMDLTLSITDKEMTTFATSSSLGSSKDSNSSFLPRQPAPGV
jgi:hypothetical protein